LVNFLWILLKFFAASKFFYSLPFQHFVIFFACFAIFGIPLACFFYQKLATKGKGGNYALGREGFCNKGK